METMMDKTGSPLIKVIGFGGCGCNAISCLSDFHHPNLELAAANTDFFNLSQCKSPNKILLGEGVCKGFGTGGDIELGQRAAEESYKSLINEIESASLLILTAGMGGGTGSGAIEIAARIARSLDIPNISFVSLPFSFESDIRKSNAYDTTATLQKFTDTLTTIPNDKLLTQAGSDTRISQAFQMANTPLKRFLSGLFDLIDHSASMHIDLSYVINALQSRQGIAIITGEGKGPNRILNAVSNAFDVPMVDSDQFSSADHILLKITGDLTFDEAYSAVGLLEDRFPSNPSITPILASKEMGQKITTSLLLTGIGATPISYPFAWSENHLSESSQISSKNNSADPFSEAQTDEFHDILEIPAFIRKDNKRGKAFNS
jgi:cell division protein FtsZ